MVLLLLIQDVMLSGVISSQTPMTSSLAALSNNVVPVSRVAMPTLGGKLSSSLADSVFIGLQSLGVPSSMSDVTVAAKVADSAASAGEFLALIVAGRIDI